MNKDNKTMKEKMQNTTTKIKEKANDVKEGIKRGVDETKVKAHLAKEDIKEGAEKIKEKVKNEISKKKQSS